MILAYLTTRQFCQRRMGFFSRPFSRQLQQQILVVSSASFYLTYILIVMLSCSVLVNLFIQYNVSYTLTPSRSSYGRHTRLPRLPRYSDISCRGGGGEGCVRGEGVRDEWGGRWEGGTKAETRSCCSRESLQNMYTGISRIFFYQESGWGRSKLTTFLNLFFFFQLFVIIFKFYLYESYTISIVCNKRFKISWFGNRNCQFYLSKNRWKCKKKWTGILILSSISWQPQL